MIVIGPDGAEIDFGDASPDQIKSAMRKRYRQGQPAKGLGDGVQAVGGEPPAMATRRDIMNAIPTALPGVSAGMLANIAPAAFGFTGNVVGGPVGGGFGGVAGETIRQALLEDRMDPGRIAQEGVGQTALGVGGAVFGKALGSLGPMAQRAAALAKKPLVRKGMGLARAGLPVGGFASGGIPGAVAGVALPFAGKAAMKVATSPKTAAVLRSPAFQAFARQNPRGAAELLKALTQESQ